MIMEISMVILTKFLPNHSINKKFNCLIQNFKVNFTIKSVISYNAYCQNKNFKYSGVSLITNLWYIFCPVNEHLLTKFLLRLICKPKNLFSMKI